MEEQWAEERKRCNHCGEYSVKKVRHCQECNGTGELRIYETSSGVSGWITVGCSACNCVGKFYKDN